MRLYEEIISSMTDEIIPKCYADFIVEMQCYMALKKSK